MSLKTLLPWANSTTSASMFYDYSLNNLCFIQSSAKKSSAKSVPIYLKRQGFFPRKPEDFGDGGAFPEIHVSQFPLGMASVTSTKTLPVTVDAHGNVLFDATVRQNENSKQIVYSQHSDLIPKILKNKGVGDEDEESEKKIVEEETKAAIDKILNAAQRKYVGKGSRGSKYIKYKPSQQSAVAFNSGAKERIIRMVEKQVDPLDLPKFKDKKVPKPYGSSNHVPILHSPPRSATVKERQDWIIPPCISDWKNGKGYTIPLDKRLANDRRAFEEAQMNDKFVNFTEVFCVGERILRESISLRQKVQREREMMEKERKEQELRVLAQKARSETSAVSEGVDYSREEKKEQIQREKIRKERGRERERERRMVEGKKSKITRDRDRDVSEKVALGMACTGRRGGEVMYDQRLFNQDKGMDSGFATDDTYNLYDKGLFSAKATLSTLYRPKKDMDDEMYGNADKQLDKLKKTEKFKPDKAFTGASERVRKRERPVEFEKEDAKEDLFGLDRFMSNLKKGKKHLDTIGSGGTMIASSSRDGHGGSYRTNIDFERSS